MRVRFDTKTHRGSARFTVPKRVRDQLGLRGDEMVGLRIVSPAGHFEEPIALKSGSEVYGRRIRERGIGKDQPITVEIWRL